MNAHATLTTESKKPECVLQALAVDNGNAHITSTLAGGFIRTEVASGSARTLLATLDDLLRCHMIAENLI